MSHRKIAHLTANEKQWYLNKIDTFHIYSQVNNTAEKLPNLTFPDIYIYLIHNPSPYTLKAFKGTEAYRYFTSGRISDPEVYDLVMKKRFLITGRVSGCLIIKQY